MFGYLFKVFIFLTVLFSYGSAQSFVFVSDRVVANDEQEEGYFGQTDVFLYQNGSERRLTATLEFSEYDPSVSPDGQLIAFARTSFVYPNSLENSIWQYVVIDRLLGRERIVFDIPESQGMLRPAGGFPIVWAASGFYAQVFKPDYSWAVHYFDMETGENSYITDGYGIALAEGYLASSKEGFAQVLNLLTGEVVELIEGEPFAWLNNDLLIARENSFRLINSQTANGQELFDFSGYYTDFAWSPNKTRYAFSLLQHETHFLITLEADHRYIKEFRLAGYVSSLDWLDEDTLVLSYFEDDDEVIATLELDGSLKVLIDSIGSDFSVRRLP